MYVFKCVCGTYVSVYTYDYVYGHICVYIYIDTRVYMSCFKICGH